MAVASARSASAGRATWSSASHGSKGHTVAIIANQARHRGGIIDVAASQKGRKFVRTCDDFGIPMLVLVDTPGFMPGSRRRRPG